MSQPENFEFDPFSWDVHENPYPYYQIMRDQVPVYYSEKHAVWFLSRYDDVKMAFEDFTTFSNQHGVAIGADLAAASGYPTVLTMDPPKHTGIRQILGNMLAVKNIKMLEEPIRQMARDLLRPHLAKGKIDILSDFAVYLPMAVISRMIKIPLADQDYVRQLTDTVMQREDGSSETPPAAIQAYMDLGVYMTQLFESHIDSAADDSVLSALIQAFKIGEMASEEVIGFLMLLGIAGNETTTKLIGNMAYRLWQNPAERQKLVADPKLMIKAVEETVRFDGSSQILGRTCTKDIELHGVTIKAGERVALMGLSGNRDERRFDNPDVYDITRKTAGHLGFGYGVHACMGAALARLETRIAFEEILKVMPEFELDESGLARMHSPNVRGFTQVPLRFAAVQSDVLDAESSSV